MKHGLGSIDIADIVGRIIGILIFIVGVGILFFVFYNAYLMFNAPIAGLTDQSASAKLTIDVVGRILVSILIKLLLLFVMTLAGSLIAARGIGLYTGSAQKGIGRQTSSTE